MSGYHTWKRDVLSAVQHIGRAVTGNAANAGLSPEQLKRKRAKNMMTDDVWQYRSLAGGAILAEISYSYFLDHPLYGVTVFCHGRFSSEWDHGLSGCFGSPAEVAGHLAELNAGDRETLARLAAQ